MESGGIESSQPAAAAERATSAVMDDIGSTLLLMGGGGVVGKDSESFDAVHLQKMKLMMAKNVAVDKVLAPASPSPLLQNACNYNNNKSNCSGAPATTTTDSEILQIVELSDLLLLDSQNNHLPIDKNSLVGSDNNNSNSHGQLIDFEKCDVTPENLKKSDQEVSDDSLLIDLGGSVCGPGASNSDSSNMLMMMQFCDTTTSAKGDCDQVDSNAASSVQLTLLDLDDPPPPPQPEKPKAFTISFGDGDGERSEEQRQKYEKMFERFQNKRSNHRRGQSLSKVDVELTKSGSAAVIQEAATASNKPTGPNKLTKTPSSAKLPRKTFSEPSSKVCSSICSDFINLIAIVPHLVNHNNSIFVIHFVQIEYGLWHTWITLPLPAIHLWWSNVSNGHYDVFYEYSYFLLDYLLPSRLLFFYYLN